mgnify:CR=1 FL=1
MSNKFSSDDKMQKLFEGFRKSLLKENYTEYLAYGVPSKQIDASGVSPQSIIQIKNIQLRGGEPVFMYTSYNMANLIKDAEASNDRGAIAAIQWHASNGVGSFQTGEFQHLEDARGGISGESYYLTAADMAEISSVPLETLESILSSRAPKAS